MSGLPRKGVVCIFVPCFGRIINSETTASLMALSKALIANGYDYYYSSQSYPDIAELRDQFTTIWFDGTQADWMLQVDADMGFEPQLVIDMLEFGKPIVGCLYPQKDFPIRFHAKLRPGEPRLEKGHLLIEACGFGVTLIHRSAIQAMLDNGEAWSDTRLSHHGCRDQFAAMGLNRLIRAFRKIDTETGELSEDYSFCRRAVNSGLEVWANVEHELTHVGLYGFKARYMTVLEQMMDASGREAERGMA